MKLFISNLTLKIIAIILMTLYHIGLFLTNVNPTLANIFEIIGVSAFPIFIFLLNEGLRNTKSIKKYLLRMSLTGLIVYLSVLVISFTSSLKLYKFGNIFIDLFLFILIYYLLFIDKDKSSYLYFAIILIYFIFTFLVKISVISLPETLYKIIGGLFPQYSLYGLGIFLIYEIALKIYDKKIKERDESFFENKKYKISKNIIYCIILATFSILSYSFTYIGDYLGVDNVLTTYIVLASIFIIFYSYSKGYNSKIIQYSFYIYYPLHLLIIYLIFLALGGI